MNLRRIVLLVLALVFLAVASSQLESLPTLADSLHIPYFFHPLFQLQGWQWLGLVMIGAMCVVFGLVIQFGMRRLIELRDRLAPTPMSQPTRGNIAKFGGFVGGAQFSEVFLDNLALGAHSRHTFDLAVEAVTIVFTVLLIYSWWDAACETLAARALGNERAERLLVPMARKWVRALIVIGGFLWALGVFGGTQTIVTLVGTLGIGGLVVALAAKDSVENLFGSFTIMFDMPFAIGDWVKIDKVEGAVEEINLRSTCIRTSEDTLIHLPNANLIRASVENFGARRFRRLHQTLRVGYTTPPDRIEQFRGAIAEFLGAHLEIMDERVEVALTDPQEQSIGLMIDCRLLAESLPDEIRLKHEVLSEALKLRVAHDITFIGTTPEPVGKSPG